MIGFNALGQLGRLGNQMFQFAALKVLQDIMGINFVFHHQKIKMNGQIINY